MRDGVSERDAMGPWRSMTITCHADGVELSREHYEAYYDGDTYLDPGVMQQLAIADRDFAEGRWLSDEEVRGRP